MSTREPTREDFTYIVWNISQKLLQSWRGKPEKVRERLGDWVHVLELQSRVVGSLLFSPAMRASMLGSGERVGTATVAYLTFCPDICKQIEEFTGLKSLEEAKTSRFFNLLRSFFETTKAGNVELLEFSPSKIVVEVRECAECAGLPNVGERICYYTLGYLMGVFSTVMGKKYRGEEATCCAKGDDRCTIVIEV